MPWQLIYTSAPRGLTTGQSGLCTVARSADLREAVALRLEQISSYHYLQLPGASQSNRNPTISAYRILDIRGAKYYALTRIQPCGLDFTARTNHLAQHLVFQPDELARLPSPAAILRHWNGWLTTWQGDPRFLDALSLDSFNHIPGPFWPAKGWLQSTGDAGRAAGLLEGEYARGCYLLSPAAGEQTLLELFCETLQLPNYTGKYPLRPWQYTFTTFLQGEDAPTDFQWRGCRENTPAWEQALRGSAPLIQLQAVRVPKNPLAKIAREGLKPPTPPSPAAAAPQSLQTLRKNPAEPKSLPRSGIDFSTLTSKRPGPLPSKPRARYISISINRRTLLKGIGLPAVLVLLLLGIIGKYHSNKSRPLSSFKPDSAPAVAPTVKGAPTNAPGLAQQQAGALPATNKLPVPDSAPRYVEAPVDQKQLERELDEHDLKDVLTYLVVLPFFEANVIPLPSGRIEPLEKMLRRCVNLDLGSRDIKMRFCRNNWALVLGLPMNIESTSDYKLSGQVGPDNKEYALERPIVFDYSGLSNHQTDAPPIQMQVTCGPLKAFSLLFSPVNKGKGFEEFRLLVVNEKDPPPRLELKRHFLNLSATKLDGLLKEPLRGRLLGHFLPVNSARWQLRPRVRPKTGSTDIDILDEWPGDKGRIPQLGDEVNLTGLKKPLEDELKDLTRKMAELDKKITEATNALQPNVDLSLPLGKWFGLETNADLVSFKEYAKARQAPDPSPVLYLDYLDQLIRQARPQHSRILNWSAPPRNAKEDEITKSLQDLHDRCVKLLKTAPAEQALLTLQGPTSTYFLAVWKNLKQRETERAWRKENEITKSKIEKLKTRLDMIPSQLDQIAALSLCVLGPNDEPLEMIRFPIASAGNSP